MPGTTEDFKKARLGSTVMEACEVCKLPTGDTLFKKRGKPNGPEYVGPMHLVVKDARCEFCHFLGMWMAHEKVDPTETGLKYGASKIVTRDPKSGVDTLVAFVPFSSEEDVAKTLADGTEFSFAHGMLLRAERDGEGMKLMEILERGT